MTAKVRGIDVSTWQHPGGAEINWEEVEGTGVGFVMVKATQGLDYFSPWAARDIDDARAAGLLVGAYHYFEAGKSAQGQALNFVTRVAGLTLDLGAWLDWECYAPEAYTHSQEIAEFVAGAKEHLGEIGVYAEQSWADILAKGSPPITRLWVAAWGETAPANALVWQDATDEHVAGVPALVDTDLLLSTRAVNLPTAPKPKPTSGTVHPVTLTTDEVETDETGVAPLR